MPTVAFPTTAPEGSVTWPRRVPPAADHAPPPCADRRDRACRCACTAPAVPAPGRRSRGLCAMLRPATICPGSLSVRHTSSLTLSLTLALTACGWLISAPAARWGFQPHCDSLCHLRRQLLHLRVG